MGSHAAALLRGLGHPSPDDADVNFKALVEWLEHTKVRAVEGGCGDGCCVPNLLPSPRLLPPSPPLRFGATRPLNAPT